MKHLLELGPEEKVILVRRKHWFIFFLETVGYLCAAVGPLLLLFLLPFLPQLGFFLTAEFLPLLIFAYLSWLLLVFMGFAIAFTNYYLDILIVTSGRLIDIEQLGLFARDVAVLPIRNIQDIKVEVLGLLPTLLHYGNLHVQTAGVQRELIVRSISQPRLIKEAIWKLHHAAKSN